MMISLIKSWKLPSVHCVLNLLVGNLYIPTGSVLCLAATTLQSPKLKVGVALVKGGYYTAFPAVYLLVPVTEVSVQLCRNSVLVL